MTINPDTHSASCDEKSPGLGAAARSEAVHPSAARPEAAARPAAFDPAAGLQFVLLLDALVRLFIWSTAAAVTVVAMTRWGLWTPPGEAHAAGGWPALGGPAARPDPAGWGFVWPLSRALSQGVLIFNAAYLLVLQLLRLPAPRPRHARYALAGGRIDVNMLWTCYLAVLTKARYQAPFPAFLVPNLAQLPPLRWLLGPRFGPRTRSVFLVEPFILDPHDVTIGRNVTIGFNTTIAAHLQERDSVTLAPTVIEDDVLIGGYSVIPGGVRIGRGAVIGGSSYLRPGTVVGANEFWAGVPARKIRDLPSLVPSP